MAAYRAQAPSDKQQARVGFPHPSRPFATVVVKGSFGPIASVGDPLQAPPNEAY